MALEDALMLVHLYADRGSPKYEAAALRWLERYLSEGAPRAEITASSGNTRVSRQAGRTRANRDEIEATARGELG